MLWVADLTVDCQWDDEMVRGQGEDWPPFLKGQGYENEVAETSYS